MELSAGVRLAALRLVDAGLLLPATRCITVVNRYAVAPPQLARDTPVADVLHPVEIHPRVTLRNDADLPIANDVNRRIRQRLDAQVPLVQQQRLQHCARAETITNAVRRRLLL